MVGHCLMRGKEMARAALRFDFTCVGEDGAPGVAVTRAIGRWGTTPGHAELGRKAAS
jgi:hypothetical protein